MIWLWQATHICSLLKIGMPSHLFIAITHSKFENLFEEVGKALVQALACGAEQHKMRALSITLHSDDSWREVALSILLERIFCCKGSDKDETRSSCGTLELKEERQESSCGLRIGEFRKVWASVLTEEKEEMYAAAAWSFEDLNPIPPNLVLSCTCLMFWEERPQARMPSKVLRTASSNFWQTSSIRTEGTVLMYHTILQKLAQNSRVKHEAWGLSRWVNFSKRWGNFLLIFSWI